MLASLIRTIVPLIVGWLLSLAFVANVATSDQLTTLVTALITAVYYAAARLLERYVNPKFGWLLGLASAPVYATKLSTPVQGTTGTFTTTPPSTGA